MDELVAIEIRKEERRRKRKKSQEKVDEYRSYLEESAR